MADINTDELVQQGAIIARMIAESGMDERDIVRRIDQLLADGGDASDPIALVRAAIQPEPPANANFSVWREEDHPRDASGKFTDGNGDVHELDYTPAGERIKPGVLGRIKQGIDIWMRTQFTAKAAQDAVAAVTKSTAAGWAAFAVAAAGDNLIPFVPAGAAAVLVASGTLEALMTGGKTETTIGAARKSLSEAAGAIRSGVAAVAKKLGIVRDATTPTGHPTINQKTHGRERAMAAETDELVQRGVDEGRARELVAVAENFTIGSSKIRAAQRGQLRDDVGPDERARLEKAGNDLEEWIGARGPHDPEQPLFRGMALPTDVIDGLKKGARFDGQGATGSWTTNAAVADKFPSADEMPDGHGRVVFDMIGGASKSASVVGLSAFAQEQEVLVSRDIAFEVTDVVKQPDGTTRVTVREG